MRHGLKSIPPFLTVLVVSSLLLTPPLPAQGIITTVAGGNWVFRGDGGLATKAPLGGVSGVAVDATGNVYAADDYNSIVVKILPSGALRVVAGNGLSGFSGDGGPAAAASLSCPGGIAVDGAGNLYIADGCDGRVRKVSPSGVISTVAGNGTSGYSGDGGPATSAALYIPRDVAVDAAGNLYIADYLNHRVRRVSPAGVITTVAGNGTQGYSGDGGLATNASLYGPTGLAVDASGNLYIADYFNDRVRKVSPNGIITTMAGNGQRGFSGDGGPATSASMYYPQGVALDAAGNLYIADNGNSRIRKVSPNGIIATVAGGGNARFSGDGGPATEASLDFPQDVAVDAAGNVYVADSLNGRVRKVDTSGIITTLAGNGGYKFAGDGGPATAASLQFQAGQGFVIGPDVAVDGAGNLYIADYFNHRVRKVSPAGIISTVAGNGVRGYPDYDGVPATAAPLGYPKGLAVDAVGNLYVSTLYGAVYKVTSAGTITRVAGLGTGFSGDGGPAADARLNNPIGLAVDAAGNLFIADSLNQRVRKVSPAGIITTAAGDGFADSNGAGRYSGDGGPATSASLNTPESVTVDAADNLYIADSGNARVRKVSPSGTITTVAGGGLVDPVYAGLATNARLSAVDVAVDGAGNLYISGGNVWKVSASGVITLAAGNGQSGFSGDGGPATNASLSRAWGVAADTAGNVYIVDLLNERIREVLAAAPAFAVSPTSLSFSAPAGAPVVAPQLAAVTSTVGGLVWSATASAPWLSASPAAGTAPGLISIGVNVSSLSAGTYSGTVTVTAPLAANPVQTVQVQLTVVAASDAKPEVDSYALAFETTTAAANPAPRGFRIRNAGGGTLNWTARVQTLNGGNWLSLSLSSGTATAANPATIQVSTTAAGLQPGVYSGLITIESPQARDPVTVSVDLIVSQVTQTVALTQTAMNFTAAEGDTADLKQPLGIVNTGQGTLNWTARAKTMDGGNWLTLSASSGQSEAGSVIVSTTDVTVNPRSLRAGTYSVLVQVDAPGANNSPRLVTVTLQVRPAGSRTGVQLQPQALIFSARAGGGSPGSQNVAMSTGSAAVVEARGAVLTPSGGEWLKVLPTNLVVSSSDPRSIVVQPFVAGLAAGEYRGTLTFQFSDNSTPQAVEVYFLVVGNPVQTASRAAGEGLAAGCARQKIVAVSRTLGPNFAVSVGAAQPLEMQVMDDCGAAVTDATVVVNFSDGSQPLTLNHIQDGIYCGVWRPVKKSDAVTVRLVAIAGTLPTVEVLRQGRVEEGTAALVYPGGVVNAASYARGGVAPGSIVSVFGQSIATGAEPAHDVPLPKTLAGASVQIGGVDVPLFYSSTGQINAQVPFELEAGTRPQVVVKVGNQVTAPETITIAPGRPGIFSRNMDGQGQGMITDAITYAMFDANNPAKAGDYAAIYCTGLGQTDLAVPSGERAPLDKLANTTVPVQVSIGGQPANVTFAGLAPGWVGLYQVNVQIPSGITPGAAIPLVITQNGISSNTVTLAIR